MDAYEFLIGHYGSEDEAREKVEEYIKPFQGMVSFEIGCKVKAQEHGWEDPNKPKPVYLPTLSDEYLDLKIDENGSQWNDANVNIEGKMTAISPVRTAEYELDGDEAVDTYVVVTLSDDGFEREVRVHNHEGFVSKGGKEIRANYMASLFDNLRHAVGSRVKMKSVRVQRTEDINGLAYRMNTGNFTTVRIVEAADDAEEVLEETEPLAF